MSNVLKSLVHLAAANEFDIDNSRIVLREKYNAGNIVGYVRVLVNNKHLEPLSSLGKLGFTLSGSDYTIVVYHNNPNDADPSNLEFRVQPPRVFESDAIYSATIDRE